jgi:hypothetical protein
MKAYGVNPKYDCSCCPGHDRFSSDTYNNNRSKKAHTRDTKVAHRIERRTVRAAVRNEAVNFINDMV